jgi:hypothetical protein
LGFRQSGWTECKSYFCREFLHIPPPRSQPVWCLISVFGAQECSAVTLPGTAKMSRFCSRAQWAVMRVRQYSAASNTSTPTDMPLRMRLRKGKFCGAAKVPRRNSERAAQGENLFRQARVSLRWITSTPVPNTATVLPLRRSRRGGCRVDTPRHGAENSQPAARPGRRTGTPS